MSGIWMTFFFCPRDAGRYGVQSDACMIILRAPVLNAIRAKRRSVVLSVDLTGWRYGLMQQAPPE